MTFNHPPRHFFDEQMSIELDALTRALQRDSTVRAVVFTGTDSTYLTHFHVPSLLAGASTVPWEIGYRPARAVAAMARLAVKSRHVDAVLSRTAARDTLFLARTYAALDRLSRLDQVVITAINGMALGMGAIFALACDIRIMADDTKIGLVESGLEILAGASGTQRLTRTVGSGVAIELLLEGRWLTATDAEQLRLVQHVRSRGQLLATATETAERLAGRSPALTREVKRAVYDAGTRPSTAGLGREAASTIRTLTTAAARRALSSYSDYLASHEPLTDEVILHAWGPLLGHTSAHADTATGDQPNPTDPVR
ncbi:enoyl-CoA hydratase/isomerase family protein [Mycolicibacterium farcinogenes]|uniref:Enoyl-CoA hydratase/isomerase family protein n=1 Tax=Mycolicibacterium farcinogenes TaxID=1802 RepID=A0ACD1FQT5_MYCFR|nr:enoyl-CoA hydratase/isomerase family protein [Mycolicibacterium farcinogenes]QZH69436.1 enoyl-CoA hydratase/isomerase family protein [Mycolicibacterium farcinogenes]